VAFLPAGRPFNPHQALHYDGDNRLAVIAGAAHGFEPDQRRRALTVVVADVDGKADLAGNAFAPAGGKRQQKEHIPQPAGFVLAGNARGDGSREPSLSVPPCDKPTAPPPGGPEATTGEPPLRLEAATRPEVRSKVDPENWATN
jgi:hypothetical protein